MMEALEMFLQKKHLEDCIIWLCTVALYRESVSTQMPFVDITLSYRAEE